MIKKKIQVCYFIDFVAQKSRNNLTGSFASVFLIDCKEVVSQGWGSLNVQLDKDVLPSLLVLPIHFFTSFLPCWLSGRPSLSSLSCGTLSTVQLSTWAEYFIKINKEELLLIRDFHLCYIITEATPCVTFAIVYVRGKSQILWPHSRELHKGWPYKCWYKQGLSSSLSATWSPSLRDN